MELQTQSAPAYRPPVKPSGARSALLALFKQIRLDRSRPFSECRGERTQDDPHRDVHFFQNGLPFDASGCLVEDDGKTESWRHQIVQDNGAVITVVRHPLYNQEMRQTLARTLRRLERRQNDAPGDTAGEVNFELWLKGEEQHTQTALFAAAKRDLKRNYSRLRDLVDDLVYEDQVVPEAQVAPKILDLLDQPD